MDWQTILALLGTLGIGSWIGSIITSRASKQAAVELYAMQKEERYNTWLREQKLTHYSTIAKLLFGFYRKEELRESGSKAFSTIQLLTDDEEITTKSISYIVAYEREDSVPLDECAKLIERMREDLHETQ